MRCGTRVVSTQIVEYVLELLLGTYGAVESLWCSGME